MEALLGLFLIVVVFAVLSGAGRSTESERPAATRSDRPANSQATAAPQEGGIGSLWPALILLLTIAALMYNVR